MVARGMIRFGSLDSSPYIAVDSKPTHDQNAKNSPSPALAPAMAAGWNAPIGFSVWETAKPSGPPPLNSTASPPSDSMTISVTRNTPNTLAARFTSKYVRMQFSLSISSAGPSQG